MPLITILVEDSQVIRESLIAAMSELVATEIVAIAETADEAIAALQAQGEAWQLAVVDLQLRQGTGLAVLRAFRDRPRHQHMIVLTNYATAGIRQRCAEAGADAVFDKSTEVEAFFDLCALYLAQAEGDPRAD